ncbi:hypothetical protein K1719_001701 [Acacia pycnantha]|nr:hypothetical protein K1719_001701 [Acacia pycnantha]
MKQLLMDRVLPFLPEEVFTDILKRLPVKSLFRFQSVCKYWKNLIKTPSFIKDHLHISTRQNPSLLIEHINSYDPICLCLLDCEMQSLEVVKNPPLFGSLGCVCIVGSSNGLLCLADPSGHPNATLLWNPATREARQVPKTFEDFHVRSRFGFGFSPIINDYRYIFPPKT